MAQKASFLNDSLVLPNGSCKLSLWIIRPAITTLREKFPNTEFFLVRIFQSECGKIRTRKNSVFAHFSNSAIVISISRSNRSNMFFEIGVLNYFATFTGKHLCWSVLLKLIKKRPIHVFSCEYCEIFNPFSLCDPLRRWWSQPTFEQQYHENCKSKHCLDATFLKEYSISFLVISRLIDFSLVVL